MGSADTFSVQLMMAFTPTTKRLAGAPYPYYQCWNTRWPRHQAAESTLTDFVLANVRLGHRQRLSLFNIPFIY